MFDHKGIKRLSIISHGKIYLKNENNYCNLWMIILKTGGGGGNASILGQDKY